MHNLKQSGGSYKGFCGEIMFKLTRRNAILTRYWTKQKWLMYYGNRLSEAQIDFLREHWYSLDCIELADRPLIFEIKTKNEYNVTLQYKQKITENTVRLYLLAETLGFHVVSATVLFKDDWNYDVVEKEFDPDDFCIDKPKRYDFS
jgi:hypothetical protein